MAEPTTFYEDDEPSEKIMAAWNAAPKQMTGLWHEADPWDACLDVDPFTGQPDHEHGDACENEGCCE